MEEVELRVEPPFGVVPGKSFEVQPFPLEPGDRIVLLTDGMQERNAVNLDVAAALADSADLHPREVVHELGAAVLRATGGDLRDDATMVCLDWYGGPPRDRHTEQGADPDRASAPAPPLVRTEPEPGRYRSATMRIDRAGWPFITGPLAPAAVLAGAGRATGRRWPRPGGLAVPGASRPTWRCSSATPTGAATRRRRTRTRSSPPPTAS